MQTKKEERKKILTKNADLHKRGNSYKKTVEKEKYNSC